MSELCCNNCHDFKDCRLKTVDDDCCLSCNLFYDCHPINEDKLGQLLVSLAAKKPPTAP